MRPPSAHRLPRPARGFTLVEVLVALLIMAVLAGMAWRGIDAMVNVRNGAQAHAEETLLLNTVLSQWEQDLAQVQQTPGAPALRFDGTALRLTRRSPEGMQLVVWTVQENKLYRWNSPPLTRLQDLQEWWMRSQQWTGIRDNALNMLGALNTWQVYYYRQGDNSWSNAQSTGNRTTRTVTTNPSSNNNNQSGGGTGTSTNDTENGNNNTNNQDDNTTADEEEEEELPQGVRLILALPAGELTRDVLVLGGS